MTRTLRNETWIERNDEFTLRFKVTSWRFNTVNFITLTLKRWTDEEEARRDYKSKLRLRYVKTLMRRCCKWTSRI